MAVRPIKINGVALYKQPWYGSYHSMMDRCYRETSKNYKFYGGRGITVCEEWHEPENFARWAGESGYKKDYGWIELKQTEIIAPKTVNGLRRKNRQTIAETIMF